MARKQRYFGSSRAAKIARALVTLTGRGTYVFNDAIVGGRSIKVWNWDRRHYEVAMDAMVRQGIACRLVTTSGPGGCLRIHTQEA